MTRIYTSGSVSDASNAVAGALAQSAIRDAILLNTAWELVEEFDGTAGTHHNVVLRCKMASSGLPKDFYVALVRAISTGANSFLIGEDYSARVLSHVIIYLLSATRTLDITTGLSTVVPTVNLTVGAVTANNATLGYNNIGANHPWLVIADSDHVILRDGAISYYLGAFTSLVKAPIADPVPLVGCCLTSSAANANASFSSVMRMPGLAASPAAAYAWSVQDGYTAMLASNLIAAGDPSQLPFSTPDRLQGGPMAFEIPVTLHANATTIATNGYLRGKYKKLLGILTPPTGTAVADTFTIDGKTYVVMASDATRALCADTTAVA